MYPEYMGSYDRDTVKQGNVPGYPGSSMRSPVMPLTFVEGAYTLKEYLKVSSNSLVMQRALLRRHVPL